MALTDGMDVLAQAGTHFDSITVIGGGARSAFWGRILASSLGKPLVYRDGAELGPAYGAARLARLSLKESTIEEVCKAPSIDHVIEPEIDLTEIMQAKRHKFKAIYQKLKPLFAEEHYVQ